MTPAALALTTRNPWAEAMFVDSPHRKDVENRTGGASRWRRAQGQWLFIHAARGWSERGAMSLLVRRAFDEPVNGLASPHRIALDLGVRRSALPPWPFLAGMIIGHVRVADVHDQHPGCCDSPWAEDTYYDADQRQRTGLVHLVLTDPRKLAEPKPATGRLGLWYWSDYPT